MKKIIFLLVIFPLLSFGQKTVNFWYFQNPNDTIPISDSAWVSFKYTNMTPADTLRLGIQHILSDGSSTAGIEILKVAFAKIDLIPTEPDGTTKLYIKIPNYTLGKTELYHNYAGVDTRPVFFIRSNVPDITPVSWSTLNDTTQQAFSLMIDYTFKSTNQDTIQILIGDSVVYKGLYKKAFYFQIPNFNSSGTYNLTIIGWNSFLPINVIKPTHVISGLFPNTVIERETIHYYNIQGQEIQRPDRGFCIWKTQNRSGKIFIE